MTKKLKSLVMAPLEIALAPILLLSLGAMLGTVWLASKIFSEKEPEDDTPPPPSGESLRLAEAHTVDAARLCKSVEPKYSHIGGAPPIADKFWPQHRSHRMHFLLRLNLKELHRALKIDWLPGQGDLLFFVWLDEDISISGKVLHRRSLPKSETPEAIRGDVQEDELPNFCFVAIEPMISIPTSERLRRQGIVLSEAQADDLERLREWQTHGQSWHQIGGFPMSIQDDQMELESQCLLEGKAGVTQAPDNEARQSMAEGEWRLLAQIDSESALNLSWVDEGRVYFWILEADARAGRFDRVQVVVQFH
jgi:uncharacterized protein YwqG